MIICKHTPVGWLATHTTISHIHEYGFNEATARSKAAEKVRQYERAQLGVEFRKSRNVK